MIELTDATIREANGDFNEVVRIMKEDSFAEDWMLRSDAFITTPFIASKFVLHFWKNGDVVIWDTDRPVRMDISDDDLRELVKWCKINGWKELQIDDRLIGDRVSLEYWNRSFIAGLVHSETLKKREDDEMARLMKAQHIEESENDS